MCTQACVLRCVYLRGPNVLFLFFFFPCYGEWKMTQRRKTSQNQDVFAKPRRNVNIVSSTTKQTNTFLSRGQATPENV